MKRTRSIICFLIFVMFITACAFSNKDGLGYSIIIKEYDENGSHIKYPQIEGLKSKEKQDSINTHLKEQVFLGAKNHLNEPFVDFSNPDYVYNFESGVGFASYNIASFWYSFDAYGEVHLDDGGVMRDTSRFYCVTIDMKTGEVIELSDFMIVDERLINSADGDNIEPDYSSATQPNFHRFKDAFMIYDLEDEKDSFHIFTDQEIIGKLKDTNSETNWYIDENENVVFSFDNNFVKIPYNRITELIHSQYLNDLNQ